MIKGIYTSVSGLAAAERRQQILSSNIANANTPGYKADDVTNQSFESIFADLSGAKPGTGAQSSVEQAGGRRLDASQGGITETGNPLDIALDGPGYFVLQGMDGPLYTRTGRFSRDAAGVLRSADGNAVLGVDGLPITARGTEVKVGPDGTVTADGRVAGRVRVVNIDAASLKREGTATFTSDAQPTPASGRVVSGALENSNVDVTATMSAMMMLVRAFEAGRQAVQVQNDTLGATVNQVGSLL